MLISIGLFSTKDTVSEDLCIGLLVFLVEFGVQF